MVMARNHPACIRFYYTSNRFWFSTIEQRAGSTPATPRGTHDSISTRTLSICTAELAAVAVSAFVRNLTGSGFLGVLESQKKNGNLPSVDSLRLLNVIQTKRAMLRRRFVPHPD